MIETTIAHQTELHTNFLSQAVQEVMGVSPWQSILSEYSEQELDSPAFQQLWKNLQSKYGALGCRGIAYRMGRTMFKYGLQEFGALIGAAGLEFRLSPTRQKLLFSLKATAEILKKYLHKQVTIEETDTFFLLQVSGFNTRLDSGVKDAVDQSIKGMTQAALDWASGGKYYCVKITGQNDPDCCTLKIDNSPLK